MINKPTGLFPIGKLSKLTGASLRSLRYYEKLGLLTPAYTDPETGYRSYTFDQSYQVAMIMFCIELDIPLKELPKFSDENDMVDFRSFLDYGKTIAMEKLMKIKHGLRLIRGLEQRIRLFEQYPFQQVYTRQVPAMQVLVRPCGPSLANVDMVELFTSFVDVYDTTESWDDGFFCEHTPQGQAYYAFVEAPQHMANHVLPAGAYLCRQSDAPQIENVRQLFAEQLADNESFIVVETEILFAKQQVDKHLYEVRVLPLN